MRKRDQGRIWFTEAQFWDEFGTEESSTVDFKERLPKKIQDSLVAFANSGTPGTIVCGVDESRPRRIVGIDWRQEQEEKLEAAARETQPPIHPSVRTIDVDGRTVALVSVEPLDRGWVQTSDGRLLVRAGPTNRALVGDQLARFVTERGSEPVEDRELAGTSIADLRGDEFSAYLRQRVTTPRSDPEVDGRALGLLSKNGKVRLCGMLVFGKKPQEGRRRLGIEITRYAGSMDGAHTYRGKEELTGTLSELVHAADRAIYDEMRRDAVIQGLIREEVPEFPPLAVREALLNAVGHRDYSQTGTSIVVRLFDDGVEIESPGTLAGPVTVENLRDAQYSRNPRIMELLHDLHLVEEAGTGIDRMVAAMEDALLDPPDFEERSHSFTVRFRGRSVFSAEDRLWVEEFAARDLASHAKVALVFARRNGSVTNEDLRSLRALDSRSSRAVLQGLVSRGLLESLGRGRGTKYTLASSARQSKSPSSKDEQLVAVVAHARRVGSIVNRDVRGLLQVGAGEARALLDKGVREGYLTPIGKARGRYYVPVDE